DGRDALPLADGDALGVEDGQRANAVGFPVAHALGGVVHGGVHVLADQVHADLAAALERHVDELHALPLLEHDRADLVCLGGGGGSLCCAAMPWVCRARWAAPRPVPAGTRYSIGLVGSHATAGVARSVPARSMRSKTLVEICLIAASLEVPETVQRGATVAVRQPNTQRGRTLSARPRTTRRTGWSRTPVVI